MPRYAVYCDFLEAGEARTHERLVEELKRHRGVRVQVSSWFVECELGADELLLELERFTRDGERVMVAPLMSRPAWHYAYKGTGAWLNQRF